MPPNYTRRFTTRDEIQVSLIPDRGRDYKKLEESRRTEDQQLYRAINQAFAILKETPDAGKHIANDRIPMEYIRRYGSGVNFWKYDILGSWRLIYTTGRDEGVFLVILIEWMSHDDYERRFRY
jgi:hypothetical protein